MRFFSKYPLYRYTTVDRPKKLDDYREFLINFMHFIFERIIKKYFQKYDTERYAASASVPSDHDFYRQMQRIRDDFIEQVKFHRPTYSDLKVLVLETICYHERVYRSLTYNKIIAGELKKHALPNMEVCKQVYQNSIEELTSHIIRIPPFRPKP
jgi:hypothetical protein